MASIVTYLGFQWGVDSLTLTEDDGAAQPRLLSVTSPHPNVVRATFDIDMMFLEDPTSVLKPYHWTINEQISGDPLPILYVTKVSELVVDVHTSPQKGVTYDVAVAGVASAWNKPIDLAFDTGTFTGTAEVYPTFATMRGFFGLDSGMQGEQIDVSAPYVDNEDPAPLATLVDRNKLVAFDLLDAEDQLDLTTVQVWIEGSLAYDGTADTFYAPYNGGSSARTPVVDGQHFVFHKTTSWTSYKTISVRVYAEDFASFTLDITWTFRIEDYVAPVLEDNLPLGSLVAEDALIQYAIKDVGGSGVTQSSIQATVQGLPAIVNGLFQVGFNGPSSDISPNGFNGYDVVIDRVADHPSSGTVNVVCSAQDVEGNTGNLSWSFSVVDHAGPLVTPIDPVAGEIDVSIYTDLTLELEDDSGIDHATILVEVDPGTGFVTAFDYDGIPQFKSGWDGASSNVGSAGGITTIVIDKTDPFNVGTIIQMRVTAKDIHGNPARLS